MKETIDITLLDDEIIIETLDGVYNVYLKPDGSGSFPMGIKEISTFDGRALLACIDPALRLRNFAIAREAGSGRIDPHKLSPAMLDRVTMDILTAVAALKGQFEDLPPAQRAWIETVLEKAKILGPFEFSLNCERHGAFFHVCDKPARLFAAILEYKKDGCACGAFRRHFFARKTEDVAIAGTPSGNLSIFSRFIQSFKSRFRHAEKGSVRPPVHGAQSPVLAQAIKKSEQAHDGADHCAPFHPSRVDATNPGGKA